MTMKAGLLNDPRVWGAIIAARFAQQIGLPHGNYWEPQIAKTLTNATIDGRYTRDEIEQLMALQLGLSETRKRKRA